MATDEKSIDLRNSVTLRCAEHGRSSGFPLLLLPGLGDSWRSFEPVLEHLPDSIRALAVTQRGHGDADHPREGYGFSDFAGDLEALLDALALKSVVIAAHSASGFFAQRFAIDNPERTFDTSQSCRPSRGMGFNTLEVERSLRPRIRPRYASGHADKANP